MPVHALLDDFSVYQQALPPSDPKENIWWCDTSIEPNRLYRWNNVKWVPVGSIFSGGGGGIDEEILIQIEDKINHLQTQITINAQGLASKVSKTEYDTKVTDLLKRITESESKITQTADKIEHAVMKEIYEVDKNGMITRISEAESKITQTAESITSVVRKDDIISSINQSAEQIQISADKISFEGTAIFDNFSDEVKKKMYDIEQIANNAKQLTDLWRVDGATTINGGLIASNTITAESLLIGNFDNLFSNGTMEFGSKGFELLPNARITNDPANAYSGKYVLRVTPSATAHVDIYEKKRIKVYPGEKFYLEGYFSKNKDAAKYLRTFIVQYLDRDGKHVAYFVGGAQLNNTWKKVVETLTVPANASEMLIGVSVGSDATADYDVFFDNLYCRKMLEGNVVIDGTLSFNKSKGGSLTLGGSGNGNGTFSLKNSSDQDIVTMNNVGIQVNNGAISVKRKDGYTLINDGTANFDFAVFPHDPPFRDTGNVMIEGWWYITRSYDWKTANFYSYKHTGRYLNVQVYFAVDAGSRGWFRIVDRDGNTVLAEQSHAKWVGNNNEHGFTTLTIDIGVPTGEIKAFYLRVARSEGASDNKSYIRLVRAWVEG